MIAPQEFISKALERGDIQSAFDHCVDRARSAADVPLKTVDPWADYKLALNRAISELCRMRQDL